ncbi:MAG TPA: DUF4129 domain-containing protein [Blastocatellia bacterium]|nr:DUF4129 domain-containing protein [Blastocatellia bacterium]
MPKTRTTTLLCLLLLASEAAAGSRLLNYENRVVRAAEQIERIKTDREYGEEAIIYIKKELLPRSEQIEFEGNTVTVDNTWLHEILDSYASEKDPQQKIAKLNNASGRLRSLDDHLRRVEADSAVESSDAGERIREILSRPAYQPEPETPIGAFLRKVLRKIRGVLGEIYSALTRLLERLLGAGAGSGWIGNVLLVVIILLGLLAVVRFGRKIRRPQGKRKKTRVVLGEEVALDSTSRDLAEAGFAAARAGDFRTAVRKLYVSLLYELSERGLIELEDSATNHEYLRKAARFAGVAAPMRYLTDRFDYVWYGMFPASEDDFADYLARYMEAMENVRIVNQ